MAGIRLEWAQFGDFDYFDVIRSDTSMASVADVDLPTPITTGLTTMYYVDTAVVVGATYFYKIRVNREDTSIVSNEIRCAANILWQPNSLDLAVWIDLSDISTITKDESNKVSAILDKSGNNRHAYQSNSSQQPFYSEILKCISSTSANLVRMVGSFGEITDETINQYTLFCVVRPTKISSYTPSQSGSGVGFYIDRSQLSTFFGASAHDEGVSGALSPVLSVTTNCINLTETRDGYAPMNISRSHPIGSQKILVSVERKTDRSIRSGVYGTYANAAPTSITKGLGWDNYHLLGEYDTSGRSQGDLHEVILIHNVLSTSDLQKVEGYLAHKWGVENLLPIDHPYKDSPPFVL